MTRVEDRIIELRSELRRCDQALAYYKRLDRVRSFVRSRPASAVTATDAARIAGLERHYFSTFFHARVGIQFREWLILLRLLRAVELLEDHNYRVGDLARAAGFPDARALQRAFRRHLGTTPSAYRLRVRQRLA